MSVRSINHEIATQIMLQLPDEKKATLEKAINRNFWLTSAAVLENGTIKVYKEGWYIQLFGCRSSFSVFAYDRDGEFEIARKPKENKLNFLYEQAIWFQERDYEKFIK